MNIREFKIDEAGHAIITYVEPNGLRATFDLTAHIEEIAKAADLVAVDGHMRKYHGHQL